MAEQTTNAQNDEQETTVQPWETIPDFENTSDVIRAMMLAGEDNATIRATLGVHRPAYKPVDRALVIYRREVREAGFPA